MEYTIRPYRDADADRLAKIMQSAILAIGPSAYSPEQIDAWAGRVPGGERFRERVTAGAAIFIAADTDDVAQAYSLLEISAEDSGHLDHLYCHPDHTRRGLAEAVLSAAETHAREQSTFRLFTEASELARAAFERAGYVVQHRRDFELDGVPIHNFAMEKLLK